MKAINLNMLYVVGYVLKREQIFHRLYRELSWLLICNGIVVRDSQSGRNGVGHGLRHELTPSPCRRGYRRGG